MSGLFAVTASLMLPSLSYCHFGKRHILHPNGIEARNQRAFTLMFVHWILLLLEQLNLTLFSLSKRTPLSPEACASITQPVLIIQVLDFLCIRRPIDLQLQGEKNELCQMKYAERLVTQLTGVPDGAILYDIKGPQVFASH
jgi:hypothetical protein